MLDSVENGALQRIESYGQQRGARTGAFGRVCMPVGSVARGHAQAVVGTENVKPGAVSHGRGGGRPRNKYTPHDQAHMLLFYEEQRARGLSNHAIWNEAERRGVTHHTASSMSTHFRKELSRLTQQEKHRLRGRIRPVTNTAANGTNRAGASPATPQAPAASAKHVPRMGAQQPGGAGVAACNSNADTAVAASNSVPRPAAQNTDNGVERVRAPLPGDGRGLRPQAQPRSRAHGGCGDDRRMAAITWQLPSRNGAQAWGRYGFLARKRGIAGNEGGADGADVPSAARPRQRARCDGDVAGERSWVSCEASSSTSPGPAPSLSSRLQRDTFVDKLVQRMMRHTSHGEAACYAALHLCSGSTAAALAFLGDPRHFALGTHRC